MILSYRLNENKIKPTLDVVNNNDEVTGLVNRNVLNEDELMQEGKYVRTVNCFIRNHRNQIWIPIRSKYHRFLPNELDFSCGGYVHSGESYEKALIGGLKKEVNLDVKPAELTLLGKLSPLIDQVKSFMEVYKLEITEEKDLKFNQDDYEKGEWINKNDLIKRLQQQPPAKTDLLTVLLRFQEAL